MPRLHGIFSVHKPDRSYTMIKKHNTNSVFKVGGNKVLKSNGKNSNRMGGKLEKPWLSPYNIQKDLDKGRYCLKTLEGKSIKANHPLCSP